MLKFIYVMQAKEKQEKPEDALAEEEKQEGKEKKAEEDKQEGKDKKAEKKATLLEERVGEARRRVRTLQLVIEGPAPLLVRGSPLDF